MPHTPKRAYSFKEGLAMMAAKDVGIDPYLAADAGEDARSVLAALRRAKTAKGADKAKHIAAAQTELRKLNPQQHGKLINALQAKVLAMQGRGGDTAVAHLEPGEMIIPRAVLTPELAQLIAAEAAKRGIDPKQLIVGSQRASINPATGAEEFGFWGKLFTEDDELDMSGVGPVTVTRRDGTLYEKPQGTFDVPAGAPVYTSGQLIGSALARDKYNERVAPLSRDNPADKIRRHAIRLEERANTPQMVQDVLNKYRPLKIEFTAADNETYRTKDPSKTNPKYNAVGKVMKALGPVGIAASAALATDQIANADDKVREAFGVGGSVLGSVGGGALGTVVGTTVAPGPGSIIGGVGGSVTGSHYGQEAAYELYDKINKVRRWR